MANYYHTTSNYIGIQTSTAKGVVDVARTFGSGNIFNYNPITNTNATDFQYFAMPNGPRTMLNYITSFGVNQSSQNTGSNIWDNGHDPDLPAVATPISSGVNYFSSGVVDVIKGDGSTGNDVSDWCVFYFKGALGDFDGNAGNSGNSWILGEDTADAASNGGSVSKARIWGYNGTAWILLWEMTAGSAGSSTGQDKNNIYIWTTGSYVTSGNGKRSAWDNESLSHFGFSVGNS